MCMVLFCHGIFSTIYLSETLILFREMWKQIQTVVFFYLAANVFFLYSDKAKSKLFLLHPEVFSFNLMIIFAIHPTCFMPDGIFKIRFYVFFHFLCLLSFLYVKGWHYNSISRRPMFSLTHWSVWHNNNTVSA